MIRFLALILLSLFFVRNVKAIDDPVAAQNQVDEQKLNITRIKQSVDEKETELEKISKDYNAIQNNINEKAAHLAALRERAEHLEDELKKIAKKLKRLKKKMTVNAKRMVNLKKLSTLRIKALFFKKHEASMRLLNFVSREDYLRDAFFLSKIDAYDRKLFKRLLKVSNEQQKKEQELQEILSNRDLLKNKLVLEEQAISESLREEQLLKGKLKQKKDEMEETLAKLRAEALRLETVVKSLTGATQKNSNASKDVITSYGSANLSASSQGQGLEKGKLERPIQARIYRPYGTHIAKGFRELVTSRGVEFSNTTLSPVYAISDGRVLYLGEMPAYGRVMIISHGKRYYSLYGKLLETMPAVGDEITKGTKLGSSDNHFYFEIRREGQPVNPSIFYPKGLE